MQAFSIRCPTHQTKLLGHDSSHGELRPAMQICTASAAMLSALDRYSCFAKASANVLTVLTAIIPWGRVVADGKVGSHAAASVGESVTFDSRTSNFLGVSPRNLREMTPSFEVAHIWVVLTIKTLEIGSFIVVHAVGDHGRDVLRRSTSTNVLAISAFVLALVDVAERS
jgi:hypothetical protein